VVGERVWKMTTCVVVYIIVLDIYIINLVMLLTCCGGEQTFRENIPPPVMCPREVFAKIARDFQMICFVF
jgi:hypothetical protein